MIPTRTPSEVRAAGDITWFLHGWYALVKLGRQDDRRLAAFFTSDAPVYLARAPGRLDVMGGIADYSGSRVLELPLACEVSALVQPHPGPSCTIATARKGGCQFFTVPDLTAIVRSTPSTLAAWFRTREQDRWASYVVGVVQACLQRALQEGHEVPAGLAVFISSDVPEGRGVASSAALEIATAVAVAACCDITLDGPELAALCQAVENHVVGAPCGIMDQMTSACGRRDRLLQLRCQPGTIEAHVEIPAGYRCYGIDSGISHAVSGADYGTVRTAAFMGYRMITAAAGLPATRDGARVAIDDARWGGYLANLTPAEFAHVGAELPEALSGAEFLERYGAITDTATTVRPDCRYPVRAATAHPVGEERRVERFVELLGALERQPETVGELGRLMYESHQSYSACGLGSDGTDRLVELVRALGPEHGLFGAKITGGGSGGTVAILGTRAAESLVHEVATRYQAETGRTAQVFEHSGPGAMQTGALRLEPAQFIE